MACRLGGFRSRKGFGAGSRVCDRFVGRGPVLNTFNLRLRSCKVSPIARAGQRMVRDEGRLEDRISVGALARAFPRSMMEVVVDAAGVRERRRRMLPAWLVVYCAIALFMDMGGGRVMRKLAGTLARASRRVGVSMPSEEALSNARSRLGSEPLRL